MVIRPVVSADINQLYELNTLFENVTTKGQMEESLNKSVNVCIAVDEGQALGYCAGVIVRSICYGTARIDIEALYVKEECRRQGVGKALIECLVLEAKRRGIYHFHLNTGANNQVAQALYKKIGFCSSGEILMEKTITP